MLCNMKRLLEVVAKRNESNCSGKQPRFSPISPTFKLCDLELANYFLITIFWIILQTK